MHPNDKYRESQNPYAAMTPLYDEPKQGRPPGFHQENFQPLVSVWLHPRYTVGRIVSENPALHVVLLSCLTGIGNILLAGAMVFIPIMAFLFVMLFRASIG